MVTVEFNWFEYVAAVNCGLFRFAFSQSRQARDVVLTTDDWLERLECDILGASGEIAVANWLNRYWNASVDTFKRLPDLTGAEVRTTQRADGHLIYRTNDDPDRYYILVTGRPPRMSIRGWIKGIDAMRDEWLADPDGRRESWFVPQTGLTPAKPRAALA